MNLPHSIVTSCPCCLGENIETAITFAATPMEDQFLSKPIKQGKLPLSLSLCPNCAFLFLTHRVSPEDSYSSYIYQTEITIGLAEHYKKYAEKLVDTLRLPKGAVAVDLGSNDGTMVEALNLAGLSAYGVEPSSEIAAKANDLGRQTVNAYFSKTEGEMLSKKYGRASLITANYMFANIPDLDNFLSGVKALLEDDGVFVIQTDITWTS